MGIQDRVKILRRSLGLTQVEFSERLNLAHSIVSRIETGSVPLTDKNISLICLIFGVREAWLRNGEGDMLDLTDNDPLVKEVIELMKKMDEPERQVVLNYVRWYASEQQTLAGTATPPAREETATFPLEPIRPAKDPAGDMAGFVEERSIG
jgi:transcriptional regulator with XRE-family HTH domain